MLRGASDCIIPNKIRVSDASKFEIFPIFGKCFLLGRAQNLQDPQTLPTLHEESYSAGTYVMGRTLPYSHVPSVIAVTSQITN
jgi:hypothetical protein